MGDSAHPVAAGRDISVSIAGYISAGGKSSRFRSDKARAMVGGRTMIQHVADAMRAGVESITVVAAQEGAYADLGLRTIADRIPGLGPMAALQAALHDRSEGWILLVSCDLLALRAEWIDHLARHITPAIQAVAFRGQRWEPLCALYHTRLLPVVEECLADRRLRMQDLLDRTPTAAAALPADWPEVAQANTPEQLRSIFEKLP